MAGTHFSCRPPVIKVGGLETLENDLGASLSLLPFRGPALQVGQHQKQSQQAHTGGYPTPPAVSGEVPIVNHLQDSTLQASDSLRNPS